MVFSLEKHFCIKHIGKQDKSESSIHYRENVGVSFIENNYNSIFFTEAITCSLELIAQDRKLSVNT